MDHRINDLEAKMYRATYEKDTTQVITLDHFVSELETVKGILEREYASLYVNEINSLINKTKLFGFHFAILDIRQDSRVHNTVFTNMVKELIANGSDVFDKDFLSLPPAEQVKVLSKIEGKVDVAQFKDEDVVKTLTTMQVIKEIQEVNGECAANRYIISNNQTALNVMQLYAMLKLVAPR